MKKTMTNHIYAASVTQYTLRFPLPDKLTTIIRLPGVLAPTQANTLMLKTTRHVDAGQVFIAGPGSTASALWAAQAGAQITVWTDNFAEAESLRATFTHHNLPLWVKNENVGDTDEATKHANHNSSHSLYLQAGFINLKPESCGLALIHLPRGKALQEEILRLAAAMLKPGGRLVFVGAKNEGVKSATKKARAIFGHAGIVAHKAGFHAGLALRERVSSEESTYSLPKVEWQEQTIDVDNTSTTLISGVGVFAAGRLDDGAAALIAGMAINPNTRVLDLGCGGGMVGLAAARCGATVELADISARAVAATRKTLTANGYPDIPVHLTCGAAPFADGTFDTVVTNPPFHKGHGVDFEVSQLFVKEAARVLKFGGKVYLVANAFLKYSPWLEANFSKVSVAWENKRFRVWEGTK